MKKHETPMEENEDQLAEAARALLAATADVAGDKIAEIRERLNETLQNDRNLYQRVRDQATAGTRAVDRVMHTNPYQAAAIGIGCGVLVGFVAARQIACHHG